MPDSASAEFEICDERARSSASCSALTIRSSRLRTACAEAPGPPTPTLWGRRQGTDEARQLLDVVVRHSNHPSTGRGAARGIFHRRTSIGRGSGRSGSRSSRPAGRAPRRSSCSSRRGRRSGRGSPGSSPGASRAPRGRSSASSSSASAIVDAGGSSSSVGQLLARRPERVDAQAPRQLGRATAGTPSSSRSCRELLVDPREHLLEDVLRVVLAASRNALDADRVDVAREALDELVPRLVVARAAARDELPVGQLCDGLHLPILCRSTD